MNKKKSPIVAEEQKLREAVNPLIIHVRKKYTQLDKESNMRIEKERTDLAREYTVAAVVIEKAGKIKFGCAVCSEKDNFQKVKARKIATARALDKPYAIQPLPEKVLKLYSKAKAAATPAAKSKAITAAQKAIGKMFVERAYDLPNEMPHMFDAELGAERRHAEIKARQVKAAKKPSKKS